LAIPPDLSHNDPSFRQLRWSIRELDVLVRDIQDLSVGTERSTSAGQVVSGVLPAGVLEKARARIGRHMALRTHQFLFFLRQARQVVGKRVLVVASRGIGIAGRDASSIGSHVLVVRLGLGPILVGVLSAVQRENLGECPTANASLSSVSQDPKYAPVVPRNRAPEYELGVLEANKLGLTRASSFLIFRNGFFSLAFSHSLVMMDEDLDRMSRRQADNDSGILCEGLGAHDLALAHEDVRKARERGARCLWSVVSVFQHDHASFSRTLARAQSIHTRGTHTIAGRHAVLNGSHSGSLPVRVSRCPTLTHFGR
jgi:hypothetical protein